jgi:hypothetical protein
MEWARKVIFLASKGVIVGNIILTKGLFFYYMYIRTKRSLLERELAKEQRMNVFMKINSEIANEIGKIYYKYIEYCPKEFYEFLSENECYENLIYDNKYEFELEKKGFITDEEKQYFKKEYTERLLKHISEKYEKQRGTKLDLENEFYQILTTKVKQYGYEPNEYIKFFNSNSE